MERLTSRLSAATADPFVPNQCSISDRQKRADRAFAWSTRAGAGAAGVGALATAIYAHSKHWTTVIPAPRVGRRRRHPDPDRCADDPAASGAKRDAAGLDKASPPFEDVGFGGKDPRALTAGGLSRIAQGPARAVDCR